MISLGQLADDGCSIFLNKRKLFAIKEEEIVLEGDRNICDGLWDIPVYKRLLSENNWRNPPLHPALYPLREQPSFLESCKYTEKPCKSENHVFTRLKPCQYMKNDRYQKTKQQQIKQGFNNIDTILQDQMKLDKKNSTIVPHLQNLDSLCYENIKHQTLRKIGPYNKFKYLNNNCLVIIRKRQTHTDLMEYLHASCFGTVKSTFIK